MRREQMPPGCEVLPRSAAAAALASGPLGLGPTRAGAATSLPTFEDIRAVGAPQPQGRVVPVGAGVVQEAQSLEFTTFEDLFRVLPEESWFLPAVGPQNPATFEFGSFTVPQAMTLWLFDYRFSVFRPSGLDPADMVRAEEGRFSSSLGFDLTLNGQRVTNVSYELDPHAVVVQRQQFESQTAPTVGEFNRAAANSFAAASAAGKALLPVRSDVMGARAAPFTLVASEGNRVALACVIWRALTSPVMAMEATMGGYLMQNAVSRSLLVNIGSR